MNITKELLEHMGVASMNISIGGTDRLCFLRKQEGRIWSLSLPNATGLDKSTALRLQINFLSKVGVHVMVRVVDFGTNWCDVSIPSEIHDIALKNLLIKLSNVEWKDDMFGRREEPRLTIGKSGATTFGLSSSMQRLLVSSAGQILPCVILDASIHGVKVVAPFCQALRTVDKFIVLIDFKDFSGNVPLKVHKVYVHLDKSANDKVLASISCQILEPIHFYWKERVMSMIWNSTGL